MNIENTLNELYSLTTLGIKLGLDNIKTILKFLDHPENSYKIIHIAGTNGKGSTASIVEAGLIEQGYKVGKYTSPHIEKFNERIVINKMQISDEKICKYYKKIKSIIDTNSLQGTFFEITTAIMFEYFRDNNCDYVVLETGLGGRFDATNVGYPIISIITNISLDHVDILGKNILDIAREKCGIIKNNKLIIADSQLDLIKAVEEQTFNYTDVIKKYSGTTYRLTKDFKTEIFINKLQFNLSLYGKFQVNNFLAAYEALKELKVSDKTIQDAISQICWPGRFEIYSKLDPLIILDGAHNVDSAARLKENMLSLHIEREIITIVSILKNKDRSGILKEIVKFSSEIIFTSLNEFSRGTTGDEHLNLITDFKNQIVENDIIKAFELAKKSKKIIVICGSFYLLSKFKRFL